MTTPQTKIDDVLFDYDLIEIDEQCLGNINCAMIEIQRYNFKRGVIVCAIVSILLLVGLYVFMDQRISDEARATNYYYNMTKYPPIIPIPSDNLTPEQEAQSWQERCISLGGRPETEIIDPNTIMDQCYKN